MSQAAVEELEPATSVISISRVYPFANTARARSHSLYESLELEWGPAEHYHQFQPMGEGKYSEVFQGVDSGNNNSLVVIKNIRPGKERKIKREVKILEILTGGPNIMQLLDVIKRPESKAPSLIVEHVNNTHFRTLYPTLTDSDIRFYTFQLLRALDYAHSRGIMHRDLKPHNIGIDHERRALRLLDWGLSDFYYPGKEYTVRVASRWYKGPELLVDLLFYDYGLDMWSLGCTLATMMLQEDPLFPGEDNDDQLVKISQVLGTRRLREYLDKYRIELHPDLEKLLADAPAQPWSSFVTPNNTHLVTPDGLDLLDRLLRYDHAERLTAREAMAHPWFDGVRGEILAEAAATGAADAFLVNASFPWPPDAFPSRHDAACIFPTDAPLQCVPECPAAVMPHAGAASAAWDNSFHVEVSAGGVCLSEGAAAVTLGALAGALLLLVAAVVAALRARSHGCSQGSRVGGPVKNGAGSPHTNGTSGENGENGAHTTALPSRSKARSRR